MAVTVPDTVTAPEIGTGVARSCASVRPLVVTSTGAARSSASVSAAAPAGSDSTMTSSGRRVPMM